MLTPKGSEIPNNLGSSYRTTLDYYKLHKLYKCQNDKPCEGLVTGMQGKLEPQEGDTVCSLKIVVPVGHVVEFQFHIFPVSEISDIGTNKKETGTKQNFMLL